MSQTTNRMPVWVLVSLLLWPMLASAQEKSKAASSKSSGLAQQEQALEATRLAWTSLQAMPALLPASVAGSLRDAEGNLLWSDRGGKAMVPASTWKLLVTAAALDQFGPDHRFETRLEGQGYLDENGTWQGDLVLVGSGDPTLGSGRGSDPGAETLLAIWTEAVAAAGIKRVSGTIRGDGSLWGPPAVPDAWAWDDVGNYFAPPLDALSFDNNEVRCRFNSPASPGDSATLVSVDPALPGWTFTASVTSGPKGSGDRCWAYAAPGSKALHFAGTLPPGRQGMVVKAAFPDPAAAAAARLELALKKAGLSTLKQTLPVKGTKSLIIWQQSGNTLGDIIAWTNRESVNGYAESLLRAIGEKSGDPSPSGAAKALKTWLTERGLPPSGWTISDGSGLSRRNALTADGLTWLLQAWQQESWFPAFYESLPRSGGMGTLASVAPQAPGRLVAKSGTMAGIRGYAGYVLGQSGSRYPVVLLLNHTEASGSAMRLALEPVWQALFGLP